MVGIAQTIVAVPVAVWAGLYGPTWLWIIAAALFIDGYVLQFIGHRIEGNDAGELVLIKKLLGLPYKAVADPTDQSEGQYR